ncbi:MAG: hypothetical protein WDZ49_07435 [Litorilinea sp.]
MILPSGLAQDRVCPLFTSEHERFGVNTTPKYKQEITEYDVARLNISWFIDYTRRPDAPIPPGLSHLPLLTARGYHPETRPLAHARLAADARARPGAIWIIGNEPDRILYQDDQPPDQFAIFYHEAYHTIKQADPTAKVAFGGIVQPTPVRLLYLDRVLEAYQMRYGQRLPVDVWTFHNFILREETNNWGADIPPGLAEYDHLGIRYGILDHGNLDYFTAQVISFRQWMAARGYRNKPLLLSEYGILMPRQYGFPSEVVESFMVGTFDYLRTVRDDAIGYPYDDNRLVQAWSWYSLNDYHYSFETGIGANGSLFDHDSGEITPVGAAFAAYTAPLVHNYADPAVVAVQAPPYIIDAEQAQPVDVHVHVVNTGNQPARNLQVRLQQTDAQGVVTTLGTQFVVTVATHCQERIRLTFPWTPGQIGPAHLTLTAEVYADDDRTDLHNSAQATVRLLAPGMPLYSLFVPQIQREH